MGGGPVTGEAKLVAGLARTALANRERVALQALTRALGKHEFRDHEDVRLAQVRVNEVRACIAAVVEMRK